MNTRTLLTTLLLNSLAIPAWAADNTDGEIIVGRQVPSRVAYRHGDQSPEVSSARTSDVATTRHLTQSPVLTQNDLLLAATVTSGMITRNTNTAMQSALSGSLVQGSVSVGHSNNPVGHSSSPISQTIQQGLAPLGVMLGR